MVIYIVLIFLIGIWKILYKKVEKWIILYSNLNVIIGLVFDWNYDGLLD